MTQWSISDSRRYSKNSSSVIRRLDRRISYTMKQKGYVYFVSNAYNNVLYIGVTNSLKRRSLEHANKLGSRFTIKYNCGKLVYYEVYPDIEQAIAREKLLKRYKRKWKDKLVESINPNWLDLSVKFVDDPALRGDSPVKPANDEMSRTSG